MVFPVRRVRGLMALGAIALSTLSLVSCVSSQGSHESALQVPATQPLGKRIGSSKPASIDPATLARRPPPIDAYLGKISPAVFSQLKYLPLLAPAHIPEDFLLHAYDVTASGYFLIYRSQTDQCFAIEYAGAGGNSAEQGVIQATAESVPESEPVELTGEFSGEEDDAKSTQPPSLNFVPNSQEVVFFESPVFGSRQKMFYGNAAQEITAHERSDANTNKGSDENGGDETLPASSAQTEASQTDDAAQQTAQSLDPTSNQVPDSNSGQSPSATTVGQASGHSTKASLASQWLTNSNGHYRYLSGAIIPQNYPAQTSCADVSLEESVKIITSLADLTAEPTESIGEVIEPPQDSELPDGKPEN